VKLVSSAKVNSRARRRQEDVAKPAARLFGEDSASPSRVRRGNIFVALFLNHDAAVTLSTPPSAWLGFALPCFDQPASITDTDIEVDRAPWQKHRIMK
jgi:hypothetical protein